MQFHQHYSGSLANLYTVDNSHGQRLIVDPGVTWKKIQKALDYRLDDVACALATHGHQDHCKAVNDVINAGIPMYMSKGTLREIKSKSELHRRRVKCIMQGSYKLPGGFEIHAFNVKHNTSEPLGFLIRHNDEHMLFAIDTANIKYSFKFPFSIIAIECSYDRDILQDRVDNKTIDEGLAKRLLTAHMAKSNCMRYISDFCNLDNLRQIHLLHMSEQNIDKEATVKEFQDKFMVDVVTI